MKYDKFFELAEKAGIKEVELFVSTSYSLSFSLFHGEVDKYSVEESSAYIARGIVDGKATSVSSDVYNKEKAEFLVNELLANAGVIETDDPAILFKGSEKYKKVSTFNKDLVKAIGNIVGNDCLDAKVTFLYGPGANIHRSPYSGRNFEYYSEDAFLSAEIGRYEVSGIEKNGVFVVYKHFALNDCEQDRIGLGVWLNEQSAREIYLRAFQGGLEKSQGVVKNEAGEFEYAGKGGNGVMMAYTRWGTQWSGANKGLVTGIMKEEWGCNGLQITDNVLTTYVNGVDGVMAGTTTFDSMMAFYITDQLPKYKDDPVVVAAMKEASHQNLYAIAHSCGMNGVGAKATNALSESFVVMSRRDGKMATARFAKGELIEYKEIKDNSGTGTSITP